MAIINACRGTHDILPSESWKWAYVINTVSKVMNDFGFKEIHLPIFEYTELFSRGAGETSDIVEKEMYTFIDKGNRSITLRPEATAGVMRCVLKNGLCSQDFNVKLWNWGPMFRYERSQKGRYRQFYQIDAEYLGILNSNADIEIISLNYELFRRLGLRNLEIIINSVGCEKCRSIYRQKLVEYFNVYKNLLCETCFNRLDRNPLRILDCKDEACKLIIDDAPDIIDSLCDECKEHFMQVRAGLERLGIKYKLNKKLVRGLDYYTKTTYEILSGDSGSWNVIAGGGRYDNLSTIIGNKKIPGIGFACGIERVILAMEEQGCSFGNEPKTQVYCIALDDESRKDVQLLTNTLRKAGISTEYDIVGRSFKTQMKTASICKYACIIGEEEREKKCVMIKNMQDSSQIQVALDKVVQYLLDNLYLEN